MSIKAYLILIAFCLIGCQKDEVRILPADKMVDVLADVTFADQVVNLYQPEDRDSIRKILTESLLKIHDITKVELDTNLYLYMSDFEKFGPLTERVLQKYDTLSNRYTK